MFLPLVIEKDLFTLLKDHSAFSRFQTSFSRVPGFTYDVCFNNWPLDVTNYKTIDFKAWYAQTESILGDQTILFHFWCSEHRQEVEAFVENFIDVFNRFAEKNDVDAIPQPQEENEGTNT